MAGSLREYRRKRDFSKSPEPAARRKASAKGTGIFVVQLHHASHRHFDFRLELGGTLRSWAVPKGPSLDPEQKRLAVQVEDHPLDYASFEGDIPEGHYGAGHVDVWDEGRWRVEGENPEKQIRDGQLKFSLEGKRLSGSWALVRTRYAGSKPNWLLIKHADEAAVKGDVADDTPLSAWSKGRRIKAGESGAAKPKPDAGQRAKFPETIGLQLARLTAKAPAGNEWDHEIKYDGYRILIFRNGAKLRVSSRNGQDYTGSIPGIAQAMRKLDCRNCVIDAELIAADQRGHSSFDLLQERFGEGGEMQVVAFDLLFLDGRDLRELPLHQRRSLLERLLKKPPAPLTLSTHIEGKGAQAFKYACKQGLEGIISKSRNAPYREGRGGEWLKTKCTQTDEFVVAGYTQGKGAREALGSLLLARAGKGGWKYVGRVGSGLREAAIRDLLKQFRTQDASALKTPPSRADLKGAKVTWVRPEVVAEVEYRAITRAGILRQASLKGIRRDKGVRDLVQPDAPPRVAAKATRKTKAGGEVRFTHPERVIFNEPKITKLEVAQFYTDIAELILPEVRGRPLSLMRCPEGVTHACFFQKHRSPGMNQAVHEAQLKKDRQHYLYIDDLSGLLALVQMNVVEFHPWGAGIADAEHPDRLVLDLDPGPGVTWAGVVAAARELRRMLEQVGLESFVRTSGGKGLHVVVPLQPDADWAAAKEFTHALASTLAHKYPKRFVDVATKAKRQGLIFIDYLRNARGATSVGAYSLRARKGAPIAMPVSWDEIARLKSGAHYRYDNARQHLARRRRDPWEGMRKLRQTLPSLH